MLSETGLQQGAEVTMAVEVAGTARGMLEAVPTLLRDLAPDRVSAALGQALDAFFEFECEFGKEEWREGMAVCFGASLVLCCAWHCC